MTRCKQAGNLKMGRLLGCCERVMIYISTMSAFVLMLLTTADAGGRYFFNRPITGAYEITTNYLMIAAIFLGMAYGYREGAHIRVTFLTDHLPRGVKLMVNHFVQAVSIVYGAMLVIATCQQTLRTLDTGTNLSSVEIPQWPAYAIVPIGLFFMALAMLLDMRKVRRGESPMFQEDSPTS
ncbi:MAG: TRAP transporter small permease [Thermodesulfobacteriota bacterium]